MKITKMMVFLMFFSSFAAAWQPEDEPWTPSVWKAIWSPTGDKIAFLAQLSEGEMLSLYIMNIDGTNLTKLVDGAAELFCFSPDGSKIYYTQATSEEVSGPPYVIHYSYVYVVNSDGSNPHRLRNYPESEYSFSLSPDGQYTIIDGVFCTAEGEEIKLLPLLFDDLSFSPDGEWVVGGYYEDWEKESWLSTHYQNLWIMDLDTWERQPITAGDFQDRYPKWSPTGEWIVFLSDRPTAPSSSFPSNIWLVRPNGTDLHPLFDYSQLPDVIDDKPNWSPDGNWIIFVRSSPDTEDDIWVASVDGGQVYRLTSFNHAALPGEEPPLFLAEFAKRREGKTAANIPEKKGQVKESKEITKKAQPTPDNKVAKSGILKQEKPNDEKPPNNPAVPVAAGVLSLSALGYAIWRLLRIWG